MYKHLGRTLLTVALFWTGQASAAVDSYRYLHVTIKTPWMIFLFLAPFVLAPMALMGILVWRYAERRTDDEPAGESPEGKKE